LAAGKQTVGEIHIRKKGIMAWRTNVIIAKSGNRVFLWPLNSTTMGKCSATDCKTSEYMFIIATLLINNMNIKPLDMVLGRRIPRSMIYVSFISFT
jgi:hypothetical protein